MLTRERLRELLHYEATSGRFFWRLRRAGRARAGSQAGFFDQDGYLKIGIDGKQYRASRLAWFYVYGEWPSEIDHINRRRNDDRICNLRSVTHSENMKNLRDSRKNPAASGFRGVYFKRSHNKFVAVKKVDGRTIHLGHFATAAQANEARVCADRLLATNKRP